MTRDSAMNRMVLLIPLLNGFCSFSQAGHEFVSLIGCTTMHDTVVNAEVDGNELAYADFKKEEFVVTAPNFFIFDPSLLDIVPFRNAKKGKNACAAMNAFLTVKMKHPPEEKDPPESAIYSKDEAELGVENTLICFVNHFYPPHIEVSWTKNGLPVTEGVSQGRYYPNKDQTFHQISTLTFTPNQGDIYSCTVEHLALERPFTRFWEPEFDQPGHGAAIFCGVGLTFGFLGVAAGTFLCVKGHH